MPNRILHERICVSETLAALDAAQERFFYRLVVQCDDYGRFDARPAVLRARCFPLQLGAVSDADVAGWLDALESVGLVWRYAPSGAGGDRSYLQVTTWDRYQQTRAKRSKFPEPASNGSRLLADASNRSHMSPYPVYEKREARSVKREARSETTTTRAPAREESAVATAASSSDVPESKRLVGDLLLGTPGFRESPDFWATLDGLDAGIPLRTEVVKALDWLRDKRKPQVTARFVLGWLERAATGAPSPDATMPNGAGPAPAATPDTWPAEQQPAPAAAEVWTAALDALASHMSRGNFDLYFRDTRGLALDNGRLVVGVRNPLLTEQIEQRFGALLRRTLAGLAGAPADVRLVVAP